MSSSEKPDKVTSESELVALVSQLFSDITGIELGDSQRQSVRSRIARRMRALEIETPAEYWIYLQRNKDKETPKLISLLTTHHTFFFREYPQLQYIISTVLPALVQQLKKEGRAKLKVWSAGCSRGQEVYTLSMILNHHLKTLAPEMSYEILGTDICAESVAIAKNGVYHWDEVKEIPAMYLDNQWTRGTGSIADYVKAKPTIRGPCQFSILNLKNIAGQLEGVKFDLIFCRNVFIYFIPQRIESITTEILKHLNSDGFLCLGLSENLIGLDIPVNFLGNSVYRKSEAKPIDHELQGQPSVPSTTLRVLCVDDSPTIRAVMKNILSPSFGFEVVGTASNGLEAARFLASHKVDLVTLDLHMPEQNGVEYLRKNFSPSHPPVVVVSTVAREDSDLAIAALSLGACDYVEKPALDNLVQRSDEIRFKLLCAYQTRQRPTGERLEDTFRKSMRLTQTEGKLRLVVAGPGDVKTLKFVIESLEGLQPPTVILFTGPTNLQSSLAASLAGEHGPLESLSEAHRDLSPSKVYWGSFASDFESLRERYANYQTCLMVFSILPGDDVAKLKRWTGAYITLQDLNAPDVESYRNLRKIAHEIVPHTSFVYTSQAFFARHTDTTKRDVVTVRALSPSVFDKGEVIKIFSDNQAVVCLSDQRQGRGGVLLIPEEILLQDSLLLEQSVNRLTDLMQTQGDNVRAKIVGSAATIKKVEEILSERKVTIAQTREAATTQFECYFFSDTGRLRLPKTLTASSAPSVSVSSKKEKQASVLIFDESKVFRQLLRRIIEDDESLYVTAEAADLSEALRLIEKIRPSVVTIDYEHSNKAGMARFKELANQLHIPMVMISSTNVDDSRLMLDAMDMGAIDYIRKPEYSEIPLLAPHIREKIKVAAKATSIFEREPRPVVQSSPIVTSSNLKLNSIVAIGASTGGTEAISKIIAQLPAQFPAVLIAQHIPRIFSQAFAKRLSERGLLQAREAADGDLVLPGSILVAPGDMQMELFRRRDELRVRVFSSGKAHLHNPSVDVLFRSVAKIAGSQAIGVLLTGMGRDGAEGLLEMRKAGAHTIAQDERSCAVFGMPKAASDIGAAESILPLTQIPSAILGLLTPAKQKSAS